MSKDKRLPVGVSQLEIRPNLSPLKLPVTQQKLLQKLHKHVAKHGHAVALFAGSSGTGKTVAASLAVHLGQAVYCVDSAEFAQQYIGETEKNLDAILTQAATSGWILFFDEADALFGANTEQKGLLQRIESHPGLLILNTQATLANITPLVTLNLS